MSPTHTDDGDDPDRNDGTRALKNLFDVFIESSVEGLRKPDPRIYALACERMDKRPEEMIFLDDIGPNLKPPRAMGMATIKVDTPEQALAELAPSSASSSRPADRRAECSQANDALAECPQAKEKDPLAECSQAKEQAKD